MIMTEDDLKPMETKTFPADQVVKLAAGDYELTPALTEREKMILTLALKMAQKEDLQMFRDLQRAGLI